MSPVVVVVGQVTVAFLEMTRRNGGTEESQGSVGIGKKNRDGIELRMAGITGKEVNAPSLSCRWLVAFF